MASKNGKATSRAGTGPTWRFAVEARDLFGRFLFVVDGAHSTRDGAELALARIVSECHDTGRIRFAVICRDCSGPAAQRVRSLDNSRPTGKTSGAKGARKSQRVPTAATSRPSRAVREEDVAPPPAPAKKPTVARRK